MTCNCVHHPEMGISQEKYSDIHSISAYHLANLLQLTKIALAQVSPGAASKIATDPNIFTTGGQTIATNISTTDNGVMVTSSYAEGKIGDIVLRGTIGPFPYELHIKLAIEGTEVSVTLTLTKPIVVGPYTYKFKLGGATFNANQEIIGATTVTATNDMSALDLNWWCVLKCGGLQILPTLLFCLPALAGGPAAYVACVVAKVGAQDAAEIAICVAQKCA